MKPIQPLYDFSITLPLFSHSVRAGFPSPADDYLEQSLDLNTYLIAHPAATYFVRVQGDSMRDEGIYDGSVLVVDRALPASNGDVIIAALDGELTCKILDQTGRRLLSGNTHFPPIQLADDAELVLEGVVTFAIKRVRCLR